MTYERFLKIGIGLQSQHDKIMKIGRLGVDLIDTTEGYEIIITELIKEVYGEEGYDWFSWFCYDNDFGRKDLSATKDGNPICYSWLSLYKYLESLQSSK
jgi:hypothetical protein